MVAFDPGPVKLNCTVPAGTLFSVNCPWLPAVVEIPVPTTVMVTPGTSMVANGLLARDRADALFTVPEIDAPADDDGATGDNEALPDPPHAVVMAATHAATITN